MMMIENDNNDSNSDNDDKDNNNEDNNKIPVDSPHTFVESKNNSRVSGDLRRYVPHVTSLWCDIFTQHRHICIVVLSSYE